MMFSRCMGIEMGSPYHDKSLPFDCGILLLRLIECSAHVADCIQLVQIAVVLLLMNGSFQSIRRCIGTDLVGSFQLQKGQHRRLYQFRIKHIKDI